MTHTALSAPSRGRFAVPWRRLQVASGVAFSVFLVVHLAATFSAPLGPGAFDRVQGFGRALYQVPVIEVLLAVTVAVHVLAAIMRARGGVPAVRGRRRLHRVAGMFLALIIVEHVAGTRLPAWLGGADASFVGPAFTLAWLPEWFAPYYFVLAVAGMAHGLYGVLTALGERGVRGALAVREGHAYPVLLALGAGATLLALAAFAGVLFPIEDPFDSDFARWYLWFTASGAGG
jgi:succinate dehydrogenase/fumarate reductase cytochrome b subunit